jgi:hypothetical protein
MSTETPAAPRKSGAAGRRLWRTVLETFDLQSHELELLRQLVRTADVISDLDAIVAADGLMSSSAQGPRVHPAAVEARQQRQTLGRLLAALQLPANVSDDVDGTDDGSERTQRRSGFRGPYSVGGAG